MTTNEHNINPELVQAPSAGTNFPLKIASTSSPSPTNKWAGGKTIRWENGVPVPFYEDPHPILKANPKDMALMALAQPYQGEWCNEAKQFFIEPRFEGLTNGEVAYIKAAEAAADGNLSAFNMLLDRAHGKPKQSMESVSIRMGIQDWLEQIGREDGETQPNHSNQPFIEVQVSHGPVSESELDQGINYSDDPFESIRDL